MLISDRQCIGSDELSVMFFECPNCLFERVPFIDTNHIESPQTQFCPGCSIAVEWNVEERLPQSWDWKEY